MSFRFQIYYGYGSEIQKHLLEGDIDFGVVDSGNYRRDLRQIVIGEEELILCGGKKFKNYFKNKPTREQMEIVEFVTYAREMIIADWWLGLKYNWHGLKLNVVSKAMDVQGVATLIASNVGIGILPRHSYLKYHKKKLFPLLEEGKKVINKLSLLYPREISEEARLFIEEIVRR